MTIEQTIKVGDFVTAASVSIALLSILITSIRDRHLKRKEYADRIRAAAAATAVAVERRGELALHLYEDIEPTITDADALLLENHDVIATGDFFWRGLVAARAKISARISDEKLDSAYVGLYGYTPQVQQLYTSVMSELREADAAAFSKLLDDTQSVIRGLKGSEPFTSACLGNLLRKASGACQRGLAQAISEIVSRFRAEMLILINASDTQIIKKTFPEIATDNKALQRTPS